MPELNGDNTKQVFDFMVKHLPSFHPPFDLFQELPRESVIKIVMLATIRNMEEQIKFQRLYRVTREEFEAFVKWEDASDRNHIEDMLRTMPELVEDFRKYRSHEGAMALLKKLKSKSYSMNQDMHYSYECICELLAQPFLQINAKISPCEGGNPSWKYDCNCDPCTKFRIHFQGMLISHDLQKLNVPLVWVYPDLCRDMLETKPDESVLFADIQLPDKAGCFMLPKGIIDPIEIQGKMFELIAIPWQIDRTMKVIHIGTALASIGEDFNKSSFAMPAIIARLNVTPHEILESFRAAESRYNHIPFVAMQLFLNFIAVQTSLPEMYVPAGDRFQEQPAKNKKRGLRVGVWHPAKLGEKYRRPEKPADGTHASPRLHRVLGHFTNQPHGEGRKLRKLVWIKPYWRGLGREEKVVVQCGNGIEKLIYREVAA